MRRANVIALGPQHIKIGELTYTQIRTRKRKPVKLTIPVHPELARIIEATPFGHLTFLTTQYGGPFTITAFGNRFAIGDSLIGPFGLKKISRSSGRLHGLPQHYWGPFEGLPAAVSWIRFVRSLDTGTVPASKAPFDSTTPPDAANFISEVTLERWRPGHKAKTLSPRR
jgi:hypothetical protein